MNPARHLIGYWIRDLKDEEFCAPQEVVGTLAPDVRSRLADYLERGAVDLLNSQWGYSWCRFFCDVSYQKMGSLALTDGTWTWPEGLSHYVRAHGITLPEEFIAHALVNGSARRLCEELPEQFLGPSSLEYWRKWCAAHRSPEFLKRLRRARARADTQAPLVEREYFQRRISEEVARYGLGDERCIFAGCQVRVLSGKKLCARHVLREDPDVITSSCYAITAELLV